MPSIELNVTGGGFKQLSTYLGRLASGGLERIQQKAAEKFAERARRNVEKGYQTASFHRSHHTLRRYTDPPSPPSSSGRVGTPDPRMFAGTRSMQRSGLMSRSVVVKKSKGSYFVQIDPVATYPDGKRVAWVADRLEKGWTHTMRVTRAMLAYLHTTRPQKDSPAGRLRLGSTIVVRQRPRPIWEPVFNKLKSWKHIYYKVINVQLKFRK